MTDAVNPLADVFELAKRRIRRMQITKGARFEAARRHKFAARSSTYAIVILSTWIFGLSIFTLIYPSVSKFNAGFFTALNLILSFFVVAFSLMQAGRRHEVRSELFLKCAQEIDGIATDFEREIASLRQDVGLVLARTDGGNDSVSDIRELVSGHIEESDKGYQKILTSFPDNHSDMDYNIYYYKSFGRAKFVEKFWKRQFSRLFHLSWRMRTFWYVQNNVVIAVAMPILALALRPNLEAFVTSLSSVAPP